MQKEKDFAQHKKKFHSTYQELFKILRISRLTCVQESTFKIQDGGRVEVG